MRTEQVICDGCGADLTTRTNSVDYRLVLMSEPKPGSGSGFYTDMMIYPDVDLEHHFCGLDCLDLWMSREKLEATLSREWYERWADEKGTTFGNEMRSYPSPPKEMMDKLKLEWKAAALRAYPVSSVRRNK